jgi:carboxyl-terminal processing protease
MVERRSRMEYLLVGVLGLAVAGSTIALVKRNDNSFFDPIVFIHSAIQRFYVEKLDDATVQRMQDGAIKGMVEALNDPYTIYVPASEAVSFNKDLTGEYVGIGAQVNVIDGWLTIVSPLEDSPAFKAGIMAEDRVVEIEGQSTFGLTVEQCVEKLMGQPETPVAIVIERKGARLPMTIVRKQIKTVSVKGVHREETDASRWDFLIDPKRQIAYIRLTQFTPRCADELFAALKSVGADKGDLKGLVLDLRFNPGGLLSEAIDIADLFLKDGVIVSTRGRAHKEQAAKATLEGTLPDFPVAVLLNGQSASASEVLAGALVENNRATVVGTRSFGKGSVQSVRTLDNGTGAELKITEQGYYLPSGRSITRKDTSAEWGVDPSDGFYVPQTDAELIEMLRVRRELEILRAGQAAGAPADTTDRWEEPDWVLDRMKDKQLSAAVRAVQKRVDTGVWEATGEPLPKAATVAGEELIRLRAARDRITRDLIRVDRRVDDLETAAGTEAPKEKDFWSDSIDVSGGKLQVFDKDGKLIATLDITGNSLERWLIDAEVSKKDDGSTTSDEKKPEAAKPGESQPPGSK